MEKKRAVRVTMWLFFGGSHFFFHIKQMNYDNVLKINIAIRCDRGVCQVAHDVQQSA